MQYIGNCSNVINFKDLMDDLLKTSPRERGTRQKDDIHHNPKVVELRKKWYEAGYKDEKGIWWLDYDIPDEVSNKLSEWLKVEKLGGWITCVPPGYCVPWHYDIDDNEETYYKLGTPVRYTCHISPPKFGQVFVLEDHAFYNEQPGNVYKWDSWQDWHGGINIGLEPKYLLNFMGIIRK